VKKWVRSFKRKKTNFLILGLWKKNNNTLLSWPIWMLWLWKKKQCTVVTIPTNTCTIDFKEQSHVNYFCFIYYYFYILCYCWILKFNFFYLIILFSFFSKLHVLICLYFIVYRESLWTNILYFIFLYNWLI